MVQATQERSETQSEPQAVETAVLKEYPNSYLVEDGEAGVRHEPKTRQSVVRYSESITVNCPLDEVSLNIQGVLDDSSPWGDEIAVICDLTDEDVVLRVGERRLQVPDHMAQRLIDPVVESLAEASVELDRDTTIVGNETVLRAARRTFEDLINQRVRWLVIQQCKGWFGDTIEVRDQSWAIGNYAITAETDVVDAEDLSRTVANFSADVDEPLLIDDVGVLTEQEQQFLATVLSYAEAEEYLGTPVTDVDEKSVDVPQAIREVAKDLEMNSYNDRVSGRAHHHSYDKHTVVGIGVTEEALEEMVFNHFDHAGPHELLARRGEFQERGIDVFEDDVDDSKGWEKLRSSASSARISAKTRRRIDDIAHR